MSWKAPTAVFLAATMIKLLLLPAYKSTDFEVHRNWLAITHSLPLSKWYYEETSEWTLDYPPLFAWFEWFLSLFASLFDPLIVHIDSLYYDTDSCVRFQRISVMLSDLTLFYAVYQYCRYQEAKSVDKDLASIRSVVLSLLVLFNYGLLVVDHIHFQYNGFLFGILLLSVTRMLQGRYLEAAFLFAVLLNLKHLFLFVAPAYFVYLLKHYCFAPHTVPGPQSEGKCHVPEMKDFLLINFIKLGAIVVAVFVLSFGPFIYMGQLGQVLSRLFPFKRGLCHAYWAPNFWALYSAVDKAVAVAGAKLGLLPVGIVSGSMTSGLVGEMQLQSLPSISPLVTMATTLLTMLPSLAKLWFRPSQPVDFLKALILCAYASFLFAWHVHEKAVLMIILPMCLLAIEEEGYARVFLLLSLTAHVSLFPLLHWPAETPLKVALFVLCSVLTCTTLRSILSYPVEDTSVPHEQIVSPMERRMSSFEEHNEEELHSDLDDEDSSIKSAHGRRVKGTKPFPLKLCSSSGNGKTSFLSPPQLLFVCFLLIIQFYCLFVHGLFGFLSRLEFLPLLLTSVSCAIGVVWSWVAFYHQVVFS